MLASDLAEGDGIKDKKQIIHQVNRWKPTAK
jgi:hypothetical protein